MRIFFYFNFDSGFDYNYNSDLMHPKLINDNNEYVCDFEDVKYNNNPKLYKNKYMKVKNKNNYYNKHNDGFDLYKCYYDSKEYDNLNMINVRKNYDNLNMINV